MSRQSPCIFRAAMTLNNTIADSRKGTGLPSLQPKADRSLLATISRGKKWPHPLEAGQGQRLDLHMLPYRSRETLPVLPARCHAIRQQKKNPAVASGAL